MSVSKHADSTPTMRPPPPEFLPAGMIITVNCSVTGFGRRWNHCHQMANYLARYASANEGDPDRHATLLSTFFNELLEAIYRNHESRGQMKIDFRKQESRVFVRASVPINEASKQFYRHTVELLSQPDPMSWYRDRLEHDAPDEDVMVLGLLELAVVYGAKLAMSEADGELLLLDLEFPVAAEGDDT